jgi:mitotic-spindle organizing protein 1
VKEISDLLNTGLDEETLQVCVQLLEAGVNPEALAAVVQELRRETAAIKVISTTIWKFKSILPVIPSN